MIAIILCAGFATRMYPLTKDFPKPLLPVAEKCVIDYLMDQMAGLEALHTVHIVTNAKFIRHFKDWQKDWKDRNTDKNTEILLHNDGATSNDNRLGASADLQFVLRRISTPEQVMVAAGDNIFQFSLIPLWEQFTKINHHCVVALKEKDLSKLKTTGVLDLDKSNRVLKLTEKPEQPASHWCCPPIYFLQPSAWGRLDEFIKSGKNKDAPGHFISYLCLKENVYAVKTDESRIDIGSLESYQHANEILKSAAQMQVSQPPIGD